MIFFSGKDMENEQIPKNPTLIGIAKRMDRN
uniref:Uncharacterized protein n=1 Tax=Rhizophora mucronata TaxID=61149 RepID=A0A2P2QL28_RHIMU